MLALSPAPDQVRTVAFADAGFAVLRHPLVEGAVAEFQSESERGTREFFDAALPGCDLVVDVGAHIGLATLYAAGRAPAVHAFEPSPVNFGFLERHLALNPGLAARVQAHRCGLGDREEAVPLYAKGFGDSGSSIHRVVERARLVEGAPVATVPLRDAAAVLREIGVTGRSLVKIDIEGAEYRVLPALAGLLAELRPFLHVSFHPFNLVVPGDEYRTSLLRLQGGLAAAEAVAGYPHMYFHRAGRWIRVDAAERDGFLRQYLLAPKALPGLASPQYGFIDAVGFAGRPLPALG